MPRKKILIADYDKSSLDKLKSLFEAQDLDVITVGDGQSAYDKYKSEEPDLLLIEAMLPKLHGFDLTSLIYKETNGALPVIIITGLYKGQEYRNEALQSFGATDYFEKPYDNEALIDSVMKILKSERDLDEDLPSPEEVIAMLAEDLEPEEE